MTALALCSALALAWATVAVIFTGVTLVACARLARALADRRPPPARREWPRIVVLRPCEGDEPGLAENLASSLARYDGERRVLLLVPSERDPSFAVARAVAAAAPAGPAGLVEVVVTGVRGAANRKSAHLAVGLARALEGDPALRPVVVVQADSDVRLDDASLPALIEALMEDDQVAAAFAVPVEPLGTTAADRASAALLSASSQDFLAIAALACSSGGVVVLAGALAAHHTDELVATGGFGSLEGILGEDFEVGRRLAERGRRVGISRRSVVCAARGRSWREVITRTARWALVVRRQRGPLLMASYPLLLAPTPILLVLSSLLALLGAPMALGGALLLLVLRVLLAAQLRHIHAVPDEPTTGVRGLSLALQLALGGELLMLAAWPRALLSDEVEWRGRRLRILPGGRIEPLGPSGSAAPAATELADGDGEVSG